MSRCMDQETLLLVEFCTFILVQIALCLVRQGVSNEPSLDVFVQHGVAESNYSSDIGSSSTDSSNTESSAADCQIKTLVEDGILCKEATETDSIGVLEATEHASHEQICLI